MSKDSYDGMAVDVIKALKELPEQDGIKMAHAVIAMQLEFTKVLIDTKYNSHKEGFDEGYAQGLKDGK